MVARAAEFFPELILISAGFDAHYEDDMASLGLTEMDYVWVTEQLRRIARTSSEGRIVSLLEGGYCLSALGRSVTAHIKALAESEPFQTCCGSLVTKWSLRVRAGR